MWLTIGFENGQSIDVDTAEFGADGMGATLDVLARKHGKVVWVRMNHPLNK